MQGNELSIKDFFSLNATRSKEDIRAVVTALQRQLIDMRKVGDFPEVEFPVEHIFSPGLYSRQMTLPAGGLIVGKINRHPCLNVILKGRISVLSEEGPKEIIGPCVFTSEANIKRVGLVHEETIWINVHPTNETDLEKLEEELIVPELELLEMKEEAIWLGQQ